jgi:hypothetical protein
MLPNDNQPLPREEASTQLMLLGSSNAKGEEDMAFVNERIQPADLVKYGIEEIDKHYVIGGTSARDWTVDRARDIYLRHVASGREDSLGYQVWTLYWKGALIRLDLEIVGTSGGQGGPAKGHKRVRRIDIPADLAAHRDEVLSDLRSALIAYKDGGIYATATEYTLNLDV